MRKVIYTLTLTALFFLSSCSPRGADIEQDTAIEETTIETEKEVNVLIEDMPDIVFVMSHHYIGENIWGFYVTKYGEFKLFDFRDEPPIEFEDYDRAIEVHKRPTVIRYRANDTIFYLPYDIIDVYERLEEKTCSEITFSANKISEENYKKIPQKRIIKLYEMFLSVDKDKLEYAEGFNTFDRGYEYNLYGIRRHENGDEVIHLGAKGNGHYTIADTNAEELFEMFQKGTY